MIKNWKWWVLAALIAAISTSYKDTEIDSGERSGGANSVAVAEGENAEGGELDVAEKEPSVKMKPEIMQRGIGSYLSARIAMRQRDIVTASSYFSDMLKDNAHSAILKRDAVRVYLLAGEMDKAKLIAEELLASGENNQIAYLLAMVDAVKENKMDKAMDALTKLQTEGVLGLTKPLLDAWIQVGQNKDVPKIAVNGKIRNLAALEGFMQLQKAYMYESLNKGELAREYYEKSSGEVKELPFYALRRYVTFLLRENHEDEAKQLLGKWLEANPENTLVQGIAEDVLLTDMREAKASSVAKDADVKNITADGMADLMFATASLLYGAEDARDETQLYLRMALYLRPKFPHAQLLMANVLEDAQMYEAANQAYKDIEHDVVAKRRAAVRRAFVLDAQDKMDEGVALLDGLAKTYSDSVDVFITKGDILRKRDKFAEAAKAYSRAIAVTKKIGDIHWPLFYVRGISYERSGMWIMAEKDLRKALELYPNQPDVLNYLGYSLLIQGAKLKEAKEMLAKAVEDRPEDAHILDSMGWAHYLLGENMQAVETLEKAAQLMPGDATVNDHLGDALWSIGRKTEARFQWERALTFNPEEDMRTNIQRKLKDGLPVPKQAANVELKPQAQR